MPTGIGPNRPSDRGIFDHEGYGVSDFVQSN
jgi:hypothetical protein